MLVAGCQLSSAARLRGYLCNGCAVCRRPVERKRASAPAPRKACAPSLPEDPQTASPIDDPPRCLLLLRGGRVGDDGREREAAGELCG